MGNCASSNKSKDAGNKAAGSKLPMVPLKHTIKSKVLPVTDKPVMEQPVIDEKENKAPKKLVEKEKTSYSEIRPVKRSQSGHMEQWHHNRHPNPFATRGHTDSWVNQVQQNPNLKSK